MTGVRLMPRNWPLRRSLTAIVLAVTAASLVVIAVLSVIGLRTYLDRQLDQQLSSVMDRAGRDRPPGTNGDSTSPNPSTSSPIGFLGAGEDTLGAVIDGGQVSSAVRIQERTLDPVDAATKEQLLDVQTDGRPQTVSVRSNTATTNGRTPYRVEAQLRPDGSTLIVGLPRTGVDAAVGQLRADRHRGLVGGSAARRRGRHGDRAPHPAAAHPHRRDRRPRVAALPLDRGEVALAERVGPSDTNPATEVGAVGSALNRLLDHVGDALTARQASETQVRQFVADASHEFRTPLAAIRGYAELTRRSRAELPPEITHAMERVESASRADVRARRRHAVAGQAGRSRQSPRSVRGRRRPGGCRGRADAHAAGPEHRWALEVPDDPVLVTGDALRLHQVVGNLLTNARTHTPPGTTVTAAVQADATRCVITVTDDGQGIDASLQGRLFQRFARGDSSRSRAAGSTGLGLAIVDAVVQAHQGTVDVESRPGRTRFTVTLPLR